MADCVRAHVAWYSARAALRGGHRWSDNGVDWVSIGGERTAYALFPGPAAPEVWARGRREARRHRARSVAVWSAVDEDRPDLTTAGFEAGWSPWWMSAPIDSMDASAGSERCRLTETTARDDAGNADLLGRGHTWRAEAGVDGRYAGRAWIHLDGDLAGLFDMEVWPSFQRRGLGRELLSVLVGAAAASGATRVVLNATPDGEQLYRRCAFTRVGTGRTWWRHGRW